MARNPEPGTTATPGRRRLAPNQARPDLAPFKRATELTDIALYWLPLSGFPIRQGERRWLLAFLKVLAQKLQAEKKLRLETFLEFKTLYPDLLNLFMSKTRDYRPLTGVLLQPGAKPPQLPTAEQIEAEVNKGGPVDVNQWMPDYCYWFVAKKHENQREDFLGRGGMLFLFLAADPGAKPPEVVLPRVMRTHPALKDQDPEASLAIAFSLKDKFLKQSKEIFGQPMQDDPSFPGIPFVLPKFRSQDFFRASPEDRERWFGAFDVYCAESKADNGMIVAMKDTGFDESLIAIVDELRDAGLEYPL